MSRNKDYVAMKRRQPVNLTDEQWDYCKERGGTIWIRALVQRQMGQTNPNKDDAKK